MELNINSNFKKGKQPVMTSISCFGNFGVNFDQSMNLKSIYHGNSLTSTAENPRPLGSRPRPVRDSDLELKTAERRGGSSWVTAGIPRSLPAAGEGW